LNSNPRHRGAAKPAESEPKSASTIYGASRVNLVPSVYDDHRGAHHKSEGQNCRDDGARRAIQHSRYLHDHSSGPTAGLCLSALGVSSS
jgi:hypothetical protein